MGLFTNPDPEEERAKRVKKAEADLEAAKRQQTSGQARRDTKAAERALEQAKKR